MKFTYNPNLVLAGGKDQLRFELGDTKVEGGSETCVLGDEEYIALLVGFGAERVAWEETEWYSLGSLSPSKARCFPLYRVEKSLWLRVKLQAVEAILYSFSHQINSSIDTLSYEFGNRATHWISMKTMLEKELERYTGGAAISSGTCGSGHFAVGIHDNRG